MNAAELVRTLARRGIVLSAVGDRLLVDAPRSVVDTELRATLRAAKSELVATLKDLAVTPVFIDFETRSLASLPKVGGRRYARHPSTEAVCMAARMPDGTFVEWKAGDAPPAAVFEAVQSGAPLVAHNAMGFDRFIWARLGWPRATWIDTMRLASLAGLPRNLDDLAQQILGRAKDKEGRKVTLQLSRPGKDGKLRPVTPEQMMAVLRYCRSDVELLIEIWRACLGALRDVESDVRVLDAIINDRGMQFDAELAKAIIECEANDMAAMFQRTGIDPATVSSTSKLLAALAQNGVHVENIQKDTLAPLLANESLASGARQLIEARIVSAGIATHKLRAALARIDDDGRLRDTLVYHGTHTGRWTGQGFQPQNLPHGAKDLDVDLAVQAVLARDQVRVRDLAQGLGVNVRDIAAKLVRACVCAPPGRLLAVADYSSVEPRALAWMAGNEARVSDFRKGVDIYKPMASKILGLPLSAIKTKEQRNVGKAPELGCGYGMGRDRFAEYAEGYGVDWAKMPMTPEQVIEMWRDGNPLVAGVRDEAFGRRGGLWQRLENAALRACNGERVSVACTVWERDGQNVVCILPSGRRMVYPSAIAEPVRTKWGTTRRTMTFLVVDKGRVVRKATYGGMLTENVISGICRDVLVDALLRLHRAGFEIVLHVHDEIVAEVSDAARFDEMMAIMMMAPPWANGLPLAVEGYVGTRYRGK